MRTHFAASTLILTLLGACGDPQCPPGYLQKGDRCYLCRGLPGVDSSACIVGDAATAFAADGSGSDVMLDGAGPDVVEPATDASHVDETGVRVGEAAAATEPDGSDVADADNVCPADYQNTHNGCERIDNCAPNPCRNDGVCTDGVNAFSCACLAGFVGPTCEHESCGALTIRSRADFEKYERCAEIDGDLVIEANFGDITSADLPHLEVIRGALQISPSLTVAVMGEIARVIELQPVAIEGGIQVLGSPMGPRRLHFPRLQTIGQEAQPGGVRILGTVQSLELPALQTIYGEVMWMTRLCSVDMRKITKVTGSLTITAAPYLLYSSVAPLIKATEGAKMVEPIGCCLLADKNFCDHVDASDCVASTCDQ